MGKKMNWCRLSIRISTIAILHLSIIFLVLPLQLFAEPDNNENIALLWSFGALIGAEHDQRLIFIHKDTVLHTGNKIKFFVQPLNECFIYLLHFNAQGELLLLLPSDLSSEHVVTGSKYFVPTENLWFKLDEETGIEQFFLLASAKKLEKLESLYLNYSELINNLEIKASARSILNEIKNLKHQHSTLTAAAERPVRLGGSFRGIEIDEKTLIPDISKFAIEISALNFYSRTFTIDHRQ